MEVAPCFKLYTLVTLVTQFTLLTVFTVFSSRVHVYFLSKLDQVHWACRTRKWTKTVTPNHVMINESPSSRHFRSFPEEFFFGYYQQGCIIRSILPSGMGARGVSSEHVENMKMFSCSPSQVRSDSQIAVLIC